MNRSQLRRLARDYARGELDEDSYRQRRAALIDDIVAGRVAIEREPAPEPAPRDAGEKPSVAVAPSLRLSHVVLGGLVIALAVLMLAGRDDPPPAGPDREAAADGETVPVAMLLESFLARDRWSEAAVSRFQAAWLALPEEARTAARTSAAFERLAQALRREIDRHHTLIKLEGSAQARADNARLYALGATLGIAETLPRKPPALARADRASDPEQPPPTAREHAEPRHPEDVTTADGATADGVSPGRSPQPSAQGADESVPEGGGERKTEAPAQHADTALDPAKDAGTEEPPPSADVARTEPSAAVSRDEGAERAGIASASQAPAPAGEPSVARAADPPASEPARPAEATTVEPPQQAAANEPPPGTSGDSEQYTLQLFALSTGANVERLLRNYPDLGLRVHISDTGPSRYRILYGRFGTEDEARRAFASLPAGLTGEAGRPVVRTLAELEAIGRASP